MAAEGSPMISRRIVLTSMAGAIAHARLAGALGASDTVTAPHAGPREGSSPLFASPAVALRQFMSYRYGAFIHWGPATVLGKEISWTRQVQTPYQIYDNLYQRSNPTEFDAETWVKVLKDGGFHYLTFVTKHH